MTIEIDQETIIGLVKEHLEAEFNYTQKFEFLKFEVEWDQSYDANPTDVAIKFKCD